MEPILFDLKDGKVVPSIHCHTINAFKNLLDEYDSNAGKVCAVIHYMHSLNPQTNPYALIPELGKKEHIINKVCPELNLDNPTFELASEEAFVLYNSGPRRAFLAYKNLIDKVIDELNLTNVDLSKAKGNMTQIATAIKSHSTLEAAYNASFEKYMNSLNQSKNRGGTKKSYDDDIDDDDDD